jgi:OPA family glycerol-3-phosphate transporter-like MFS transporter
MTGGRRGAVILVFLVPAMVALIALGLMPEPNNVWVPLILIAAIGFLIMSPYAFMTGVISVDLGGKRGSSTAAGLADTTGYLGGAVAGEGIGRIAENWGWSTAFMSLAGVLAATTAVAVVYWYVHEVRGGGHVEAPPQEPV